MKKQLATVVLLTASVFVLSNCSTTRKATAATAGTTYEANVQPIITSYCAPCHVPSKGGNKKPYDNYGNAKADIDDILRRIQLTPGTRGFMPMRHDKLSDSTIAVFVKWKEDGLAEK